MITYTLYFLYILHVSVSYSYNESKTPKIDDEILIPKIYNGWPAKLGEVPYQISFKRRVSHFYSSFCGGVIISPLKLLSAAHCFAEDPTPCQNLFGGAGRVKPKLISHIVAVAGQLSNQAYYSSYDSVENGQWRRLREVLYPADYYFPKEDIALVYVQYPYQFNAYVKSIPFASRFVNYRGDCLASGYGRTSSTTLSDRLLLVHLTVLPWRRCNAMHRKNMHKFVCTASIITDVGKGDSGGPLVCKNTTDPQERRRGILVGITSGNAVGIGSFFTRVSTYYGYILSNRSSNKNYFCIHLILYHIYYIGEFYYFDLVLFSLAVPYLLWLYFNIHVGIGLREVLLFKYVSHLNLYRFTIR